MADKVIRVPVVAEFQTDLRSLQDIEKALSGAFEKAGTGTAIAKGLRDSLTKIRPLLKEYEQLQIQPTIDQAGVRRMNTIFDAIINEYQKRASQIEFADPEAMLPEEVLTRIRTMRAEVASLRKEMEGIEKHGASGKSDDYFQRREATAAQQDLHRQAKAMLPSKYSGDATLQQNASTVEKEAIAAAQRAAALAEQGRKLAEALKQAEDGVQEAQTVLQQATGELQVATTREGKAQKAVNASKFYAALGGLTVSKTKEHAIVGGAGLRQSAFVDQSGKLQTEFQTMLRSVLQETGIEIDASRLIAESNASEIPGKIRQAIVDVLGDSEETITQTLEEFKARAQARLTRVDTEGFVNADQFLKSAREQRRVAQTTYDRAQQKAKEAPEQAFAIGYQIEENDDAQREAQETAAALQTLSTALKEVAAAAKEAAVAAKKGEAESREREVREATEKEKNKIGQPLENTNRNLGTTRENHQEGNRRQGESFSQESEAQREAEDFKKSMQNAVKQWMSIQQVINIVKDGIRQAYQDIQGLDKAMTNIAVVTDMSVSDLWGKINEYMSIAQQYGVTTQGVYEVSQLYYQQGLSTNEVMAATTETLKLARIAGMGYAEAADAMTVAIRSFKMDMSDAATVTDVYSKVAAITASDSEELAIAMSKTASSAESVGSSFENTTAMLAVMIETTRESAQNLGSALKSIISRYGEMKVGLTVDSEGEDIDYNKVDTALKSVGISIKDAQGQFRDFDDVIFELSEKWDSLDKNTQRYIATIMAGNRQQSRFIALVDNWERLDEVSNAAHNAEDAGLLQYAKTLDSLETKLNNIKTSFQQFYMNIFNGPVIGAVLDFINNLIQGLNKLGNWQGILNIVGLIRNIKLIGSLIVNTIAPSMTSIVTQFKTAMQEIVQVAKQKGFEAGQEMARGQNNGYNSIPQNVNGPNTGNTNGNTGDTTSSGGMAKWGSHQKLGKVVSVGGAVAGLALTSAGTAIAKDNARAGSIVSGLGNIASGASMGAAFGPWGAAIGGLIGGLASLPAVLEAFDPAKILEEKLQKAEEALQEANIEKAEANEKYTSMADYIEKLKRLEETRYDSEEDYEEWVKVNAEVLEKFPDLTLSFDEMNNAIVDLESAEKSLATARRQATDAAKKAAAAQLEVASTNLEISENSYQSHQTMLASFGASVGVNDLYNKGTQTQRFVSIKADSDAGKIAKKLWEAYGSNDYAATAGQSDTFAVSGIKTSDPSYLPPIVKHTYTYQAPGGAQYDRFNQGQQAQVDAHYYYSYDNDLVSLLNALDPNSADAYKWLTSILSQPEDKRREYIIQTFDSSYFKEGGEKYYIESITGGEYSSYAEFQAGINESAIDLEEARASLDAATQTSIYTQNDAIFATKDPANSYLALSGVSGIFQKYMSDSFEAFRAANPELSVKDAFTQWTTLTTEGAWGVEFNKLDKAFTEFYNWLDIEGLTENFNNFLSNQSSYTWEELSEILLTNFGLSEDSLIYQAIRNNFDQNFDNFFRSLDTIDFIKDNRGLFSNTRLQNIIPKNYTAEVIEQARLLENAVETGKITTEQATTFFNGYLNLWELLGTQLDGEQLVAARTMLKDADLTSIEGIKNFEKQFEETFGIEITDNLNVFTELAHLFGNLYTNIQSKISQVSELVNAIKAYSNNQTKGFSLEEAQKLFQKLKKSNKELSWEEVFTYNKEGLLVLKDFNSSMQQLYGSQLADIEAMRDELNAAKQLTLGDKSSYFQDRELASWKVFLTDPSLTVEEKAERRQTGINAFKSLGFSEEISTAFVDAIADGTIDSYEAALEWFDAMGEEMGAAAEWLRRETQKTFIGNAFDTRFNKFKTRKSATEYATISSYDGLRQMIIDLAGDRVNEEGFDPDKWVASFFEDTDIDAYDTNLLEGIELDEFGNLIITDPLAYSNSLIEAVGTQDRYVMAQIHETVAKGYHEQWAQRQQEMETFLEDGVFTTAEMGGMFAYLASIGEAEFDPEKEFSEQVSDWALENFEYVDGEWRAVTEEGYQQAIAYAKAKNPDLDFSNIPTWKEWMGSQAISAAKQQEEALKFLREISIDMGPESIDKAIELGLLNPNEITKDDWEDFSSGEMSAWELMNKYYRPEANSEYARAWQVGQENYQQKAFKKLSELYSKATLKTEDVLEIWEAIGENSDFDTWLESSGFTYDEVTQQYRALGAQAFSTIAKFGKEKYGIEVDYSDLLQFGVQQRALTLELEDKKEEFFKTLTPEAGLEELDKAYQQGIITQIQYLDILEKAMWENKTVYEAFGELAAEDPNSELSASFQEGQANYWEATQKVLSEMFKDNTLSGDLIKEMWADFIPTDGTTKETNIADWAANFGIEYFNGEWIIENAEQAWSLMSSWWDNKYGTNNPDFPKPSKAAFVEMINSANETKDAAIINFIKTITPDATDADLEKAVELGLISWEDIAKAKKQGQSAYTILDTVADNLASNNDEIEEAWQQAQKDYDQKARTAITNLFNDGLLSSEEIKTLWLAADTTLDLESWANQKGFQLINGEWQVTTLEAYNAMVQWVTDTYGAAYAAMVPSYEKLVALNPLKEAKSKKASLDFLKELTPDMDESDVLSGVEQGVFTEDQVRWAQDLVNTGASWYEAIYQTIVRENELIEQNFNALASNNVDETFLQRLLENGRISAEQYQQIISIAASQKISLEEAMIKVLNDSRSANNAALAAYEESYLNYQAEGMAAVRSMAEKGSWSEVDIVKMWQAKGGAIEGFNNWANANFEWIDNAWYVKTEQGYNDLKAWIAKEYGTAAAAMLPSFAELQHLSLFKEKATSKEQLDFLKGLTSEASYADLEKAMELGLFTSEDLNKYLSENGLNINNLNSSNILTIIGNFIKSSDTEALKAFNKAIVDENISRGESALKLFEDNVLSWEEIAELWAADGATGDIGTWAQEKGLSYIDNEWHITTREGYNAIVEAAKKIYGDAWEAVTPTYEAIMGSQQLELDIDKNKQADFFEELASDEEVTAEDVQRALELGIVTKEQIYAAQQNGWSYEKLLQFAIANNTEWKAAYQKGYGKYNETRLKELEEMFGDNDGVFSYEQVYRMWEVLGDGVDFNTWAGSQGLTFDGTSYKANAAQAYALMHGMATEWWGDAAASMIPSEAAMASLFNIEREIQLDEQLDFMKGLTPEMTMADAQKAVELGIISQDQLLWLEQTYGDNTADYFGFISQQFAAIEGADWDAFQESYEDYQATRITEARSFIGKISFSLADMTDMWQKLGANDIDFNVWQRFAQKYNGFSFENGEWIVDDAEKAWPVIKEYIKALYGFTDEDFDKGGIFADMEQQFLASAHQQTARAKEKKLSFLRGLGETLTLNDLDEALEAGILTESEYNAVISDGQITSDEIRGAIAGSLETDEEIAAYNEAIEQRNLQRIETITALFEDTALSRDEIFDMYKAAGATGDVILWAQQQGFVLEDGKWYAKTKQAYEAMKRYVEEQFGEAYLYLLPSEEEWLASGLFDDLIKRDSQISFIKEISPTASASTLKEAAEKFGIEFTQEELLLLEAGVINYYDILLEKLKASDNKEWQNWANLIELQNVDTARRNVFKQTKFTTLEEYAAAYQQLADLGFTTHEIEYILADQTIDMEETANMIRALEARVTGETNVYLQGEALLAAAKKYGLSLADFFERSVLSPAQVLEYLGLTLSDLSVDDYDDYITAQQNFNSSIQKLFEGTGTAEDMRRLIETANQAAISGYELTTDNFIITAEGIQLDRSQFFTALEILRQTDANAYRAIRESFVADPSLWGEEIDSITDVEERLNELAEERAEVLEEINALGDERNEQLEQELAALDEQASLYAEIYGTMSMQKSEGWDFLNNELHGNAENFISWSNSVHSAFEQVGSKEGIDPKNFINLLNYMQQMGVQVTTLGSNFNSWAELMQSAYSTFGKAMVTGSKVATTDIGVSAENMSTGMLDAVHAMAESQIKFLDAQIAMLEGLVALENVEFTGIGDFVTQMQAQLDKYNTAMGLEGDAQIKLDDLKISINGITYPLTEEGLAQAEAAWRALGYKGNFLDQLINQVFSPEGQKSIMSGGVVEMNPTADIKLSTDTQATISEIQTANSILREIAANTDPALQQRIAKHKAEGGADLSTEAGAIKYFNDNSGVFRNILEGGVSASDKDAYEALSAFDKEIFNMWYASQHGTRFDQSDIYGYWYPDPTKSAGGGQVTSTGGKTGIQPTFTYHTATKDAYTYEKDEDGNWEYRYARRVADGSLDYVALPNKDEMAAQWDTIIRAKWGSPQAAQGALTAEDPSIWNEWFATLDPYQQALFYSLSGQTDKLPSYGAGVTTGGAGGTKAQPSFSMDASVSDIQGKVSGIYNNTAKMVGLLGGFDLTTEAGKKGYYDANLANIEGIPIQLPEEWDTKKYGNKPENDSAALKILQDAALRAAGYNDTEIELWHTYNPNSYRTDIDNDGVAGNIAWRELTLDTELGRIIRDAVESYIQTDDYLNNPDSEFNKTLKTILDDNKNADGTYNWDAIYATEGFRQWWNIFDQNYSVNRGNTNNSTTTAEQQTAAGIAKLDTTTMAIASDTSTIAALLLGQQAEGYDLTTPSGAMKFIIDNSSSLFAGLRPQGDETQEAAIERWYNDPRVDPALKAIYDVAVGRVSPDEVQRSITAEGLAEGERNRQKIDAEQAVLDAKIADDQANAEIQSAVIKYNGEYESDLTVLDLSSLNAQKTALNTQLTTTMASAFSGKSGSRGLTYPNLYSGGDLIPSGQIIGAGTADNPYKLKTAWNQDGVVIPAEFLATDAGKAWLNANKGKEAGKVYFPGAANTYGKGDQAFHNMLYGEVADWGTGYTQDLDSLREQIIALENIIQLVEKREGKTDPTDPSKNTEGTHDVLVGAITGMATLYKNQNRTQEEASNAIKELLNLDEDAVLPEEYAALITNVYGPPAEQPAAEEEPPAEQPAAEEEPPAEQPAAEEEPPAEVTTPTVEELQSQIAENTTIIEGLNSQIATLEGQITALEGQIATLEGQVTNLESQVTTLTTNNTDLAGQISTLNTTHAQDIAALEGQITLLNTQITTLQNRLSAKEDENRDLREAMNLLQTPGSPILAAGGYDYVWGGSTPFDKEGSYFYSEDGYSYSLRPIDGYGGRSMPHITDWEEMYGALAFGNITMPEITRAVDNGYISYSTTIGEEVIPIWAEGVGYTEEFSNSAFAAALPEEFWRLDFGSEEHREGTFSSMAAAWGAWESYADIFGGTHMLSLGMDENGNFTIELDFSEEAYENFGGAEQAEKDRQKWLQYTNPESFGYYNANTTLRDAILEGDPAQVGFFTGLQNLLPVIDSIQPPEGMEEEWHGLVSNLYAQIEDQDWGAVQTTLGQMSTIISSSSGSVSVALASLSTAAGNASVQLNSVRAPEGGATDGPASVSGNVSGLALAEGNTGLDRLNVGARLAGKTLVGELGPELAVYNGMYHLLGQNGAEFVDLPSNAIVFNHRQTAGIIRGQVGYRGTALAEGNVDDLEGAAFAEGHITGPARASIDQTVSQLKSLRAMWQNILDMDASQLAQAGGGGGGGNSLKATTADLEEWYNLMRQIEQIEQEITNLEAKRANIYNGSDYLKNLRETQKLLEKQRLTQQRLYEHQRKQLQAQADFINQHKIWSKFLTVGEDGLLQYINGNEQVGGKGAIEILQKLNKMSGAEQEKFVKSLEYTAKDEEGKALEGEKLVARFYEELQDQIDQYDELYDTVHATSAELEELTSQIEEVNKEIIENQKELETNIYDIVVDAWEKEIGLLEEQAKLVEETNKAYTDGLKKALGAERDLYEENKSTEERESLQRQLALLRRSGGSAAEIADLEEQLDDALKDEYFKTQEKMIENIEDANERQVKKLEEQITLQKEALEYEKKNGIVWTKVYDALRDSQESILAFMQGNSTEFFSKSALEQEEMLLDWAKKIGIYSEDQQSKTAMAEAEKHWNSEAMWNGEVLSGLQGNYENLSDEQKAYMAEYFKKSYGDARLKGSTEAEAQRIAEENIKTYLTEGGAGTGIEDIGGSSSGDLTHWTFKFNGQDYYHYATQATATNKIDELYKSALENLPSKQDIPVPITPEDTAETIREKREKAHMERVLAVKKLRTDAISSLKYGSHAKGYSTGGLVDYTGLAMVHGSKSKPESFLNAAQTAQIKEALQATHGKENLLEGLHSTIAELRSLIHNISTINNSTNYEVSIAPGAVVINVDELANSYDVEELSADIMNRMAAIASKATNRGVNRR